MSNYHVPWLKNSLHIGLAVALAVLISLAQSGPALAQSQQITPEAQIVSALIMEKFKVRGPDRIVSVTADSIGLMTHSTPFIISFENKDVKVYDRYGNEKTRDLLQKDATVYVAQRGDSIRILVVPAPARPEGGD